VLPSVETVMGIKQVLRAVSSPASQWTVNGHEAAIANAMVACTALAQQRLERIEVEEIVERHERQLGARRGVARAS
jgi:fatty acid/phospholipid biosynthesis enzyme